MVQVSVFAAAALYDQVAIKRQQKREAALAKNPCSRCGYPLTGNTSGICPECGQAFRWTCPRCRQLIVADAARCDKCGCEWDALTPTR